MPGSFRVEGTAYDSGAVAVTVTPDLEVPAGVITADHCLLVVSWVGTALETPPTVTPSGADWGTLVAPRTAQNMGWAVFTKTGLAATDLFHLTMSNARLLTVVHTYWKDTPGFGAPGTITERLGVSSADCVAASTDTTQDNQTVTIVSIERTTTGPTTGTSDVGTENAYHEGGGSSTCSDWVGSFAGPATPDPTPTATITYTHASGNGAAVQIPLLSQPDSAGRIVLVRNADQMYYARIAA